MSLALTEFASKTAGVIFKAAEDALNNEISEKTDSQKIGFAHTDYRLPLINAFLKLEVNTLADCRLVLSQAENLINNRPAANGFNIGPSDELLNRGAASLFCAEILAALKYPQGNYNGFLSDALARSQGIQLIDSRIAGMAVIIGPARDEASAVKLIQDFKARGIISFLPGSIKKKNFPEQSDNYVFSLGEEYLSAIYAFNWMVRVALLFGGYQCGQWKQILEYIRRRIPAFVCLLGPIDEISAVLSLGALALGLPIITDSDILQHGKIDTTVYESVVSQPDYDKLADKCIEVRGIKVRTADFFIPVESADVFEGEILRPPQRYVELGGRLNASFELLIFRQLHEVEDAKIEIIGVDIDKSSSSGVEAIELALIVEVAGRRMQKDFEPVLERQIHRFLNYAQGITHQGQRDNNCIRISQEAFDKGFRIRHIGVILHAMLHKEYSSIVDKVQVKIYTCGVNSLLEHARQIYRQRDERLNLMTDENVDRFFSCSICQSYAPNHVCIISPQRIGLCGAYSWLDAKAAHEIIPSGPNQPIIKGNPLDTGLGRWKNIDDFVYKNSNKSINRISMYSLLDYPQSSCRCSECILAVIPEVNGVMAVNRGYSGVTPLGMDFTALADSFSAGVQTPGFMGIGKEYIVSKKFISAEGGIRRLVWMPRQLKEFLKDRLIQQADESQAADLIDKIADETIVLNLEQLSDFLREVDHPVLKMGQLI